MMEVTVYSFVISLACESSIAALSVALAPRFCYPAKDYASKKPGNAKLWHTTVAALFPSVFAPFFSLPGLIAILKSTDYSVLLLAKADETLWRALGVSLAHFWFDFIVMLYWRKDFIDAMRLPLYKQMMFHHLASALLWPYAMSRQKCVVPVAYYMVTEASNVFLNLRWLISESGSWPRLRLVFDSVFFFTYTVVRVLPCFFAAYIAAFKTDWPFYLRQSNFMDLVGTFFVAIPFCLNVFWYSIIIKTARKAYGKKAVTQKKANILPKNNNINALEEEQEGLLPL